MLTPLCSTWNLINFFFFHLAQDCWSGLPLLHPEEHSQPQGADASHRGPQRDLLQQSDRARVLQLLGEPPGTPPPSRRLRCCCFLSAARRSLLSLKGSGG